MNKRIKVAYGLPALLVGGIENQLIQHLLNADTSRYEFFLITLFKREGNPNLHDQLPKHVKTYQVDFKGYGDLKSYRALYAVLKDIDPDIVVSSMFSANAVFRLLKLFFHYRCITREHNTYTDRTLFHRVAEKVLSPLSDRIVAVSSDVADFFSKQNWVPRQRVTVINNGIDLERIESFKKEHIDIVNLKKELNFPESEKIVLNVARLKKQKNHELLIDVFADFQKTHSGYTLCILGGGDEEETLRHKIDTLELSHKIRLLGFRKDVFSFYQMSDFFVLSSRIEGFPNVFLEAMACGLPVISTQVPGANEIIDNGKNGFIVTDRADMLEKMQLLAQYSHTEHRSMRDAALATVERFDVRRIVAVYQDLFDRLATPS